MLESLFYKRETLAQVFSCEFCEISNNTYFYRTPPVAASGAVLNDRGLSLSNHFFKLLSFCVFLEQIYINKWFKILEIKLAFYQMTST